MHHPTDRIAHTVVEHWLEREIAQWVHPMKDRSNDPSHHERSTIRIPTPRFTQMALQKILWKMEEVSLSDALMVIAYPNPLQMDVSLPTLELRHVLLGVAQILNTKDILPSNIVFLTDCRSLLQSLQTHGGKQTVGNKEGTSRTGRCHLLSHLYFDECPCGNHMPNHLNTFFNPAQHIPPWDKKPVCVLWTIDKNFVVQQHPFNRQ